MSLVVQCVDMTGSPNERLPKTFVALFLLRVFV